MKRPQSLFPVLLLPALACTIVLSCCEKNEESTPRGSRSSAEAPAPAVKPPEPPRPKTMQDYAAKLGLAAKLPRDTEFYLSSVNLKKHLAALQGSTWWKDIDALMQDKTPAPTAGDKTFDSLKKLWGDDFFIAGGPGFAQSAGLLRSFNRVYNEIYFKLLMTGSSLSVDKGSANLNPLLYLQMFLQDPATLEKVADFISAFEPPPLIAGLKVADTAGTLALLDNTKEAEAKKILVMSDLTTPQGHKFRVATVDMLNLLPEADQQTALAKLPAATPEPSRKIIAKAYDALQAKKLMLAWGAVDGHVVLACGKNLDHLKFANSPAESVLARPEMAALLPHAEKNLAAITWMSAASVQSLNDDQPFVPMLRGVAGAMTENPTFKAMGAVLEKRIAELSPLESSVYASQATDLVAAAWWDRGLHAEFFGGIKPRFCLPGKPLKFQPLVERPGVVFGLGYHRNLDSEKAFRAWMEKFIGVIYTGAQELVKAGIAGPSGGQQFALFELMLLPTVQKIYQADKDMAEKGLGSEIAYVMDVNGKMPPLPGAEPAAKDAKFPRLTSIADVASRDDLAKGWQTINDTVTNVATIVGSLAGAGQKDGNPAAPFIMPKPESSQNGNMTTWAYKSEMFSGDLQPCAAITDQRLILSTSKLAAETFAADLAKPPSRQVEGCIWRLDLGALADFTASAAAMSPTQTAEQTKELKQAMKWLKPFHVMEGHLFQQDGQWRGTMKWEITDVVKFD